MNLDHPDLKNDREAFEKRLADLGPENVRVMWSRGMFPTGHDVVVQEWLQGQNKPRGAPK